MASDVPPSSDGGPPFDSGLSVSGNRRILLLLEQIKNEIEEVETLVQTGDATAGTDAPSQGPPAPRPPPPPKPRPPSKPKKKAGKKYRRHP